MRQVVFVISLLSAVSCGGDGGSADAPGGDSPTSPTPLRPAWTLSGTVSETFPTRSTRIAGATVTAVAGLDANGRSTTSDGSGAFRLVALPPGNYTIRVQAHGDVHHSVTCDAVQGDADPLELTPNVIARG